MAPKKEDRKLKRGHANSTSLSDNGSDHDAQPATRSTRQLKKKRDKAGDEGTIELTVVPEKVKKNEKGEVLGQNRQPKGETKLDEDGKLFMRDVNFKEWSTLLQRYQKNQAYNFHSQS